MPSFNDLYSKYLQASDVDSADGGKIVAPIEAVKPEEIGRKKERKLVVYLKGFSRGLVVNKTNAKVLNAMTGDKDNYDLLLGRTIELFCVDCEVSGAPCRGIRVRGVK